MVLPDRLQQPLGLSALPPSRRVIYGLTSGFECRPKLSVDGLQTLFDERLGIRSTARCKIAPCVITAVDVLIRPAEDEEVPPSVRVQACQAVLVAFAQLEPRELDVAMAEWQPPPDLTNARGDLEAMLAGIAERRALTAECDRIVAPTYNDIPNTNGGES